MVTEHESDQERARMAVSVGGVTSRAENRAIALHAPSICLCGERQVALVAGHEVPDEERAGAVAVQERAAVVEPAVFV